MGKDLTEGKVRSVLWGFTIPMFISVVFQQMYNLADSAIAGKFVGENALAAVGASYPITMIFMAVAVGSNIGCAVVISRYFGAKQYRKLKTAVTTTLIASTVLSIVLTALGLFGSGFLLKLLQTPADIFGEGNLYLKIYAAGLLFVMLYNIATGIFTSLGDSKTPLYFLIASSVGNILLDLLFVIVFHWGVAGVAWATFLAQGVACVVALAALYGRIKKIKTTGKRPPLYSGGMLKRICRIAVPSILQQSFVSVGNLFIQGLVNSFGSGVLAGYSAAVKLNNFTITSFSTVGNGVSGFTAQNIGAQKPERVTEGFRAGCQMILGIAIPFMIFYFAFGDTAMRLFLDSGAAQAKNTGVLYLKILALFYVVVAIKLLADGILRGAGYMKGFMISTFSDLILRVALAFAFSRIWGSTGIWLAWPVGWSIAAVMSLAFYKKGSWREDMDRSGSRG